MTRSRLFYVLDSLEENDVGDQVVTLLERLPRSRFEPRVVGLRGQGSLAGRLRQLEVSVHCMELGGPIGSLLAVPRLRRVLRGLRADVVHAFQPWSGTVAQLSAPRDAKVVRSVAGFARGPRTLERRVQDWMERRATRLREGSFLTVSDALAWSTVSHLFGVEAVEVVPDCLDLERVRAAVRAADGHGSRVRLGLTEGQEAAVVVSDFADRFVPAQFLEGFAAARIENPELRLLVVGAGPEEGAARWHAEELHLEDSVVFLGAMPERATLLRAARVAVDATAWPGRARICLEAMAVGIPVLRWLTDEHEPSWTPRETSTGGPPDRFARDLLGVVESGALRARVGRLGLDEAANHEASIVAERWSRIYTS
jgi:glycosyltransferase involved in cell wall biosynthesis